MTYAFSKKQVGLAVSCALTLGAISGVAGAEANPANTGYLTDQRGNVVKSGTGLCWRTGFWTAAMATAECDPDLVARPAPAAKAVEPAPLQAPVVVAPPAPVPKRVAARISLDADTLFDFDKSALRPAGRAALDDFVAKLQGIEPEMIMAVGFADRIGSEVYNQSLSERRVEAVKTYLVSKGIEPNRMHTEGRGETQPTTNPGECDGAKSAKVIACLQPDRRVEIEVAGPQVANR
jgi:OOP family OmpA-OmpF porin